MEKAMLWADGMDFFGEPSPWPPQRLPDGSSEIISHEEHARRYVEVRKAQDLWPGDAWCKPEHYQTWIDLVREMGPRHLLYSQLDYIQRWLDDDH
jgi:hypothetical protein